jgi:hypothetical protein
MNAITNIKRAPTVRISNGGQIGIQRDVSTVWIDWTPDDRTSLALTLTVDEARELARLLGEVSQ